MGVNVEFACEATKQLQTTMYRWRVASCWSLVVMSCVARHQKKRRIKLRSDWIKPRTLRLRPMAALTRRWLKSEGIINTDELHSWLLQTNEYGCVWGTTVACRAPRCGITCAYCRLRTLWGKITYVLYVRSHLAEHLMSNQRTGMDAHSSVAKILTCQMGRRGLWYWLSIMSLFYI